mmetsp:Transcript_46212/g.88192  ORF Transcript_46212/g.88192 Transcript_46212/m.88192 type:complete len:220 (+) Transcript_46212:1079-1738(+)
MVVQSDLIAHHEVRAFSHALFGVHCRVQTELFSHLAHRLLRFVALLLASNSLCTGSARWRRRSRGQGVVGGGAVHKPVVALLKVLRELQPKLLLARHQAVQPRALVKVHQPLLLLHSRDLLEAKGAPWVKVLLGLVVEVEDVSLSEAVLAAGKHFADLLHLGALQVQEDGELADLAVPTRTLPEHGVHLVCALAVLRELFALRAPHVKNLARDLELGHP